MKLSNFIFPQAVLSINMIFKFGHTICIPPYHITTTQLSNKKHCVYHRLKTIQLSPTIPKHKCRLHLYEINQKILIF